MIVDKPPRRRVAVVLAGAVAKGAFEAGVLKVLADANVDIVRIVATSSGALNGVVLASGVAERRVAEVAGKLIALWKSDASLQKVFHATLTDIFVKRNGISDQKKLLELLRDHVKPLSVTNPGPVDLRIIVAPLSGVDGRIGTDVATTYEHVVDFTQADFKNDVSLAPVFEAAVASAAFPIAFTPARVDGVGLCVDGGAVNNAPISRALAKKGDIDSIVIISPTVKHLQERVGQVHYAEIAGQLVEMLVNERLYRDLREAHEVNDALSGLSDLVSSGGLSRGQLDAVKAKLGWQNRTVIDIVQIRPKKPLAGSPFHGFRSRGAREAYISDGMRRASEVLAQKGWR